MGFSLVPPAAMLAAQIILSFTSIVAAVLAPLAAPDLGVDPELIGLYAAVVSGSSAVSSLLSGAFIRRKPPKGLLPGQIDMRTVGIQNEEQKVIGEVRRYVTSTPVPEPTLVLFFSDGGVYRNAEIEQQLRAAVDEPIFLSLIHI